MGSTYLIQSSSSYLFRMVIPLDLRPRVGVRELRYSMQTGIIKEAKEKARYIAGFIQRLFRKIRKGEKSVKELSDQEIQAIIKRFVKSTLDEAEDERIFADKPRSSSAHTSEFLEICECRDIVQEALGRFDYRAVTETVKETLEEQSVALDPSSKSFKVLCREILKVQLKMLDIQHDRNAGIYDNRAVEELLSSLTPVPVPTTAPHSPVPVPTTAPHSPVPVPATAPHSPVPVPTTAPHSPVPVPAIVPVAKKSPQSRTVKTLVDEWVAETTIGDNWKSRSLKKYTGHFNIMIGILGKDTPIDSIDHETVRDLKKTLQEVPSGMNKKKIFKGKSIPEIIKINKKEKFDTLSVSTINGYITTLGAFFKWCVGQGYMTTNFADGMKIKQRKQKRPDQQRQAFTMVHLNQMFQSPEYLEDTHKQPFQFWLPILGLYTGARLNELCQLRLKDIQTIDNILGLRLQEDAEDPTISLKNAASHRTIPLHPFITDELNFRGYVDHLKETGETRLFPELPCQNNNYGHKASKWFSKFKKACGLDSKLLVFHSFRHTLTDNLKQQLISETLIDELTGHALQGETMSRYGKRYGVKLLYDEAVMKLNYKVDLGHMKQSKWVYPSQSGLSAI